MFKSAAVLTVFRVSEMTPNGRRDILRWLQRQMRFIKRDSKQLAKRYTARYLYREE